MKMSYNPFKSINNILNLKPDFIQNKTKYYKILDDSLLDNNFQFQKGVNIINKDEHPTFNSSVHILEDIRKGNNLFEVDMSSCDKLILGEQYQLNKLDTIKMLIDEKAFDQTGYTKFATLWSIEKGYYDIFKHLITLSENTNINHSLYFIAACSNHRINMLEYFLSSGFDVKSNVCLNNFMDDINKIRTIAYSKFILAYQYLYQYIIPPITQYITTDICSLIIATQNDDIKMADFLLSINSVDTSPDYLNNITFSLFYANIIGKTNMASYLISKGADVDLAECMNLFIEEQF